jgi:glycosyltransferase involved in cell wall biosynthesis
MRVLQIGADRSKRGILYPDSAAAMRQRAYGEQFGELDIVGFSLQSDGRTPFEMPHVQVYPTNSASQLFYGLDTIRISGKLSRPDVISAQDPFETGLLALLIARMRGIPLHIQVHTDFLSPEYARHSVVNRLRVMVAGFVLKRATRIRAVSDGIKRKIQRRFPNAHIEVLPIFIDVARYTSLDTSFSTTFLWIGRLEKEKNPELAISSFAELYKNGHTHVSLSIVGSGNLEASLRALVKKLDVESVVRFEGSHDDVVPYYAGAGLVLVTSYYEGYGLVIVEALAAGKPVLSTDVGIAHDMGAIIASRENYAAALREWFENGPRTMHLHSYPYKNFDQYVDVYCADILSCIPTGEKA